MPLFVSGLTASIALEEVGEMPQTGGGCTVLVTAAAGATGQMAVQLAKAAGHTVIGTTSSDSKGDHLKSLGVDRVVNYKSEDLHSVLKKEFPSGVDIVYVQPFWFVGRSHHNGFSLAGMSVWVERCLTLLCAILLWAGALL